MGSAVEWEILNDEVIIAWQRILILNWDDDDNDSMTKVMGEKEQGPSSSSLIKTSKERQKRIPQLSTTPSPSHDSVLYEFFELRMRNLEVSGTARLSRGIYFCSKWDLNP
jgi:hypothetical protein